MDNRPHRLSGKWMKKQHRKDSLFRHTNTHIHCWLEYKLDNTFSESNLAMWIKNLKLFIPFDSTIPLLEMYLFSWKNESWTYRDLIVKVLSASLLKIMKQSRWPNIEGSVSKEIYKKYSANRIMLYWVSWSEMGEPRASYTEWSQRKTNIVH